MKRRMSPLGASFGRGRSGDGAAMESGSSDVTTNQEPSEVQEECSGKKKSRFQTFKKLFTRKKRKEPQTAETEASLKASQSSDDVSKTPENNMLAHSEEEKKSGSKVSLGGKALSHDSVFVSESSEVAEGLGASQDSLHGKVKSLQLQLKQAIRLGSPPSLMCVKKTEDAGAVSEDDGLPCSPPECTPVRNQAQRSSSNSLQGLDADKLSCAASSRAMSPLVVPGDFSQPASPFGCLDNSAAKHKLGLRHKACNRRKPASKLDLKAETDSTVEEMFPNSVQRSEPEAVEQQEQTADGGELLKPGEEEEEDEEQETTVFQLRDEEEEDESDVKQEVSHDSSCPPEQRRSEEDVSDARSVSSSSSSSRSPDSPPFSSQTETFNGSSRPTAEPPSAPKHVSCQDEDHRFDSSEEEEEVCGDGEEESSFLEDVLSSLKAPLYAPSPDVETEGGVLEEEEEEEPGHHQTEGEEEEEEEEEPGDYQMEEEVKEEEEGDEVKMNEEEDEVEVKEEVNAPDDHLTEEEDEEEDAAGEEEVKVSEDEDLTVEHPPPPHSEKEEEDKSEEEVVIVTRQSLSQEVGMSEEEEEEEEAEGDREVEEEMLKSEEEHDDDEEAEVEVNEVREEEAEDEEEMMEMIPDSQEEEVHRVSPVQETDEGVMGGDHDDDDDDDDDDVQNTNQTKEEDVTEMGAQVLTQVQEGHENSSLNSKDEEEGDEEEDGEVLAQKSEEEEEPSQSGETMSHLDKIPNDSSSESRSPKSCPITDPDLVLLSPSSRTTTLQIDLVSPSSETPPSLSHPPPADPSAGVSESPGGQSPAEEESTEAMKDEELEEPKQEPGGSPPAPVPRPADQSKVRFTIAPAWQRSQCSAGPVSSSTPVSGPVSPSTPVSGPVSPSTPGPVLPSIPASGPVSPSTPVSGPVSPSTPVSGPVSPSTPGPVSPSTLGPVSPSTPVSGPVSPSTPVSGPFCSAESSVLVDGNPENPFGVRLRKTSALLRFNSEEEVSESPVQSPTVCKLDSPQPVGTKPSVGPNINRPAVPKKPEVHGDAGGKLRRISEPPAGRGAAGGPDPPSWISVAKQKQKIYKENSLEEKTVRKEEQERKSLPYGAGSRENQNKTSETTESRKPSVIVEKETRRVLCPPAPVPPQPLRSQLLPSPVMTKPPGSPVTTKPPGSPVTTKPQGSPVTAKPLQTDTSPSSPIPVPSKRLPFITPIPFSKPTSPAQTSPITSPPFPSRTTAEKFNFKAPDLPRPAGSPSALPQDEPPWMALAKKKAKAWSEMPQIVQ
ncbi:uncharacterized protein KIAA1211 [Austrofundulus limnaeus]|uniref:Uncharacterized protein KIAA1211 n=1 Tax=Austrofundulus limnaeus TaxID=52670 RepID=A0A2I4CPW6_AUSLI|nr:PREDICTED: uncharacterized protein KIAA1211-like [Austrofundulus limnaeus]